LRAQRLAIVSPDTGNNTVEGGSGDQPLFTKARRAAAAAGVSGARSAAHPHAPP
jgi:hypothetical protein